MFGDLPPSSRPTFLKPRAAVSAMTRPVASEPVKAIFAVSGCSTSGMPTSLPKPVTTLTTPAGKPACSTSLTNSSVDAEVNSEGLITTVLPAASAGASFQAVSMQRRVPRRDGGHHAQRLVAREVEIALLVERDDRALDLVGQAAEVVVPLRHVVELGRHLGEQLAVVAHLDLGQVLGVLRHQVAQLAQQRAALGRRHLRPRAVGEGSMRGTHRMIGIGGVAARDHRPRLAGERVVALEPFAR